MEILQRYYKHYKVKLKSLHGLSKIFENPEIDTLQHMIKTRGSVVIYLTQKQIEVLEQ